MTHNERAYQRITKDMTPEEIVESVFLPAKLSPEEQKKADEDLRRMRFELLANMTDEDRLVSDVMRIYAQIFLYTQENEFSPEKTFAKFFAEYISVLKRTKREIADELSVHYTKLSRLVNDKEEPNIELTYRLETHSGGMIPATLWWKLIIKKQEHLMRSDKKTRKIEAKKVKNALRGVALEF